MIVKLLVVLSTIIDHSVEAQCYADSGEHGDTQKVSVVVYVVLIIYAKISSWY